VTTLLARHGWHVRELSFYWFPSVTAAQGSIRVSAPLRRAFTAYQTLARPLFRVRPWLADGMVVIAERHEEEL
jgi:hypothetical protein